MRRIADNKVKQIVNKIVAAVHPVKIILFGSYARGDMREGSDIDILVVENEVKNKGKEMVKLRSVIGNVGVGVDVLVYSNREIEERGHLPGTALYEALKEGRTLYEAR